MTSDTLAVTAGGGGVVERCLRSVRRRMLAQAALDWMAGGLLGFAALVLVDGVHRFLEGRPVFLGHGGVVGFLLLGTLLMPICGVVRHWRPLAKIARVLDRRAGTHDRFHTALAFAARPVRTRLEDLTLGECVRYAEKFPVRGWTPVRLPRAFWFVPVPLVSLALLAWHASFGMGELRRDPALEAAVARRAAGLARLADQLRQADNRVPQPDLDKVADAMKRSAEQLKDGAGQGDEQRLKTALGKLSSLEAMLAAMKRAAQEGKVSPGELAALAAALQASEASREAGESLKDGQLERAGDQLAKLADRMKAQGGDPRTLQPLAQSMQEQAAKLTAPERNEVARQMQQAAQSASAGQSQLSAQALQRLAELLRRAGRNGAGGGQRLASGRSGRSSGPPLTDRQLQALIHSLEDMKEGLQAGEEGRPMGEEGRPLPGEPGDARSAGLSLAAVEAFGEGASGDPSKGEKPAGMPGSEHDQGTNERLLADHAADAAKARGPARRIEGVPGDGVSWQEWVGAPGGGPARASRGYRQLYEAIAPAEQSSVEQEDIPLGSRVFVRRYFENIRPEN